MNRKNEHFRRYDLQLELSRKKYVFNLTCKNTATSIEEILNNLKIVFKNCPTFGENGNLEIWKNLIIVKLNIFRQRILVKNRG